MSEPRWMTEARRRIGVREVVGPKHSAIIMGWIKKLGSKRLGVSPADDETPWCGTFCASVFDDCGITPPPIAIRASAWGTWGYGLKAPCPGAVLVFTRSGGGHVGLYCGEDAACFHVLGGNQGNAVSITRIERSRLAPGGIRWPAGVTEKPALPLRIGGGAVPVSRSEA